MGRIIIYTTTGCPFSLKVKNIFEKKNVQFTEINLTEFPTVVDELADWAKGKRAIPQVFFEDEFIGGFDELQTMQNNGKLDDLIKKVQETPNGHNKTLPKSRRKTLAPWKNLKLDPVLEDVFKRLRDKSNGLELKNRFQNSHTFKGSALIKWLTVNNKSTEDEALRMAEKLRTKGYFYRIKEDKPIANDSSLFRFYADDNPDVLNGRIVYTGDSRSALDIALYLQDTINTIYEGHLNLDDGNVDYEKIKKLKEYLIFSDNTIELHKVDIAGLKTKEAILFYMAMYKVLLLHGEIVLGYKPKSKADKARLYQQYSYNIGGQNYTLEAIEAILRGKPKSSGSGDQIRKMLSRKEMARVAGLSKADPRIHFAMISCDKFSQPIRFLDSKNMDSALQWATELFCADIEVSFRSKSVNLPLLFKEYRADFGKTNKEVLSWVVMFLPDGKEEKVRQLLATCPEESITINFRKRGWEVDRIFGDLEDNEDEEFKINQRNTGDSDDLNAGKGDNQEPVDEDDDAYFNYEPVSKELLDKFNEVFSTNATTLELKDSGLKYLPKELGKGKKMDACKKVVITDNQLTMLPRWFAVTFTNLTILYINGNKLRTVPANLADIKQLETVDLSNNLISLIPNRFCTLRNLRALNLSGNNLEFLPVGFAQLRQLEELLLAHNQLAELRDNFGELNKLEILDISHNRLTVLPDSVANFKRLEEFNLRGNRLKELPATIEQLSSLVLLDLSHNDIKELPSELGGMASLIELYLANNKIKKLSKGFCDLNCSVIDLEENPLVDPPKEVCNEGLEAIRKHFNWTKPSARNAPRSRTSSANLQAELDRSQSTSSLTGAINDGTTPRDLKRLSTHEKRALLIKRVVVKKFDPTKLNEIRATVQNQDITTVLAAAAAAEEERRKERQAQNLDSSEDGPQGQSPPRDDQLSRQPTELEIPALILDKISASGTSPNLTRRIAQLIAPAGGFRIDRNEGKMIDIDDLQLQEFNFIFDYGNEFFGKPHHNFIGISKEYGAIVISISREGEEDEPEEKERKLFGTLKFKRKAKSPSVPNFFSRVQSKDKMMKKKPSTDNLKANAIDSPASTMDSPALQKRSSQANLASNLSTSTMHKDSARSEHKDSARSERLETPKEEKTQHSPRKPETPKEAPLPSPRSIRHNSSNSSITAATNSAATNSHDEDSETHETSEDTTTPREEKDNKEKDKNEKDKSEKDKDKSGRPSLHRSRSKSIEPGNNGKLMKSKSRDLKREKEKVMLKRQMMLSSVKEERKNVTMSGDFDLTSASKKQSSKRNSTELKDPKDSPSAVRFSGKDKSSNGEHRDVTPPKITKKGSRLMMTSSEKKDKEKDKEKDKSEKDKDRDSHNSEDKKVDEKDEESTEQGKNMTKTRSSRQLGISAIGSRRKMSSPNDFTAEKQKSDSITPRSAATAAESATPSALNLLIRVRKSDRRLKMSLKNFQSTSRASRMKPKQMIKLLKDEYPEYSGITFKQIKNEDMEQELLNMELRLMVKGYKYGILYAKEGQVEEEKMFCNNDPSPDFTEFLEFLAEKVELKGWEAYNGGLDVQQGMTGKHSYFTKFKDYSIMFHVSTELPFTEGDPQQIERKRHLGNDIVVIVFQEGDTPFNPTCVHSYFNHVFFVVRKEPHPEGKTMYRLSVTSKSGVAPHLPVLPDPPVFEKGPHFREFFFTKLINCERASYSAPGFAYAIENTRGQLIQQIVDNYYFD